MAGIKEIRTRIKSIEATLKITNAMYLISSASLKRAREQLRTVYPHFNKIGTTIADILHHSPDVEHIYFDQRTKIPAEQRNVGLLVITGDKGLAGAYNHNALKLTEQKLEALQNSHLYLIGQMGRNWFARKGREDEAMTALSAKNPDLKLARQISAILLDDFRSGKLDEVWVVYTNMVSPLVLEPTLQKLLPLDKDLFPWTPRVEEVFPRTIDYLPNEGGVMDLLVPFYLTGILFGALVESFCSEQSARMTAMDSASDNAKDMLKTLRLRFNRARQAAITQEITEIVAGAQAGH